MNAPLPALYPQLTGPALHFAYSRNMSQAEQENWPLLKLVFRVLALMALAMALITAVLDITRSIADSVLVVTPLGLDWFRVSPGTLQFSQGFVRQYIHPLVWDPVIRTLLMMPSWVVFAGLWLVFTMAGRDRHKAFRDRFRA